MNTKYKSDRSHKFLLLTFITALILLPFNLSLAAETYSSVQARPVSQLTSITNLASTPSWVIIPSMGLTSYVEGVGIDAKGNMDVPSGQSNNVGWYKYGPTPGHIGTAVLDAHNTAAFRNLNVLRPGDDIYVWSQSGELRHFKVAKMNTYEAKSTSPYVLFEPTDKRQMNLITCAGTPLGNYDSTHRLIVTAELASETALVTGPNSGTITSSTI